jgi:hypothetical protein
LISTLHARRKPALSGRHPRRARRLHLPRRPTGGPPPGAPIRSRLADRRAYQRAILVPDVPRRRRFAIGCSTWRFAGDGPHHRHRALESASATRTRGHRSRRRRPPNTPRGDHPRRAFRALASLADLAKGARRLGDFVGPGNSAKRAKLLTRPCGPPGVTISARRAPSGTSPAPPPALPARHPRHRPAAASGSTPAPDARRAVRAIA